MDGAHSTVATVYRGNVDVETRKKIGDIGLFRRLRVETWDRLAKEKPGEVLLFRIELVTFVSAHFQSRPS